MVESVEGIGGSNFNRHYYKNQTNMRKYQITGFQLIYPDGRRDNVKLQQPLFAEDIEFFRNKLKEEHECVNVNLSYTEIN